jgi:hypothetical protein
MKQGSLFLFVMLRSPKPKGRHEVEGVLLVSLEKALKEEEGVHQLGLRVFGATTTMWKLLIIGSFFQ